MIISYVNLVENITYFMGCILCEFIKMMFIEYFFVFKVSLLMKKRRIFCFEKENITSGQKFFDL